ncbi:restriction endonuclease subunit S [Streptomyces sp. NPDC007988]|uniref:restriction endonuclease subunit S n=1 Tax=Streptomyces sp. NPDC007988 TaxID=3364802 RepID=UPI0036F0B968
MSLNLDKSTWKRVAFGDVVRNANVTVRDPEAAGIDRVIAMEHLDPAEIKIQRWGSIEDGTTFTRRVKPGQTLFGKRRAYQRKVAYADFEAICSGDILTFEADETQMLAGFLPFLVVSDGFFTHALGTSAGSLSPRTNWRDLSNYEFDLPPLDEQKRIADLLWKIEQHRLAVHRMIDATQNSRTAWMHSLFTQAETHGDIVPLDTLIDPKRPVCYGILKPGPEFDGGRLVVDVKDYPAGRINLATVRRCDPVIETQYKRSRLRTSDILLSIRGTIGRVAVVPAELDGHNISRDSARLSGDPSKVLPDFLRLILESPDVQAEIRKTTTGLAVKGINVARIRSLSVPAWPLSRQQLAVEQLDVLESNIAAQGAEVSALLELRASLLTEIFGG